MGETAAPVRFLDGFERESVDSGTAGTRTADHEQSVSGIRHLVSRAGSTYVAMATLESENDNRDLTLQRLRPTSEFNRSAGPDQWPTVSVRQLPTGPHWQHRAP